MHIWYGRLLILLGIINGGLGLQLAANTTAGEIIYGSVAGIMLLIYLVAALWWYVHVRRARETGVLEMGEARPEKYSTPAIRGEFDDVGAK